MSRLSIILAPLLLPAAALAQAPTEAGLSVRSALRPVTADTVRSWRKARNPIPASAATFALVEPPAKRKVLVEPKRPPLTGSPGGWDSRRTRPPQPARRTLFGELIDPGRFDGGPPHRRPGMRCDPACGCRIGLKRGGSSLPARFERDR